MTRIWLNHWFSTAYNIIKLMRKNQSDFYIIGTNEHEESPIKSVCDEWYREPALKNKEYIDFCLNFCREHRIDVFVPHREMISVSKYKEIFTSNGIKVMVDKYDYVSLLNQKDKAYEAFKAYSIGNVPEYYMATDINQFKSAYDKLSEKYERLCFKFVRDEGGKSYRLIDNSRKGYSALFKKQTTRISIESALDALSEKEMFSPLMIMPYLPDEEISVDCLMTESGLISVPRVKNSSRIEEIRYDNYILSVCRNFFEKFPLEQPCNIQFKYSDGIPYILEVNTRMSGGIQMSCLASGINIPNIAVNKLLEKECPWQNEMCEKKVTHIEVPIVL